MALAIAVQPTGQTGTTTVIVTNIVSASPRSGQTNTALSLVGGTTLNVDETPAQILAAANA